MTEHLIYKLFKEIGLSDVIAPIESVSGGFMHRMYKVHAGEQYYAVKHLNPSIMSREEAIANYDKAEALESILEETGIPIVSALVYNNSKRQVIDGHYFYVFKWQEGNVTDWNHISGEQCYLAGNILGRIHSIEPEAVKVEDKVIISIDWDSYIDTAVMLNHEIAPLLSENKQLLVYAENELNKARKKLPNISCITDGDMDPKNVMWESGKPRLIDLECLDYGNPISHALQLALQWSGTVTCNIDLALVKAFFEGYLQAYDNGFRQYDEVFGLAYSWIEWLEYNMNRVLDSHMNETERNMGLSEFNNTLKRIRYIYDREEEIKTSLRQLFLNKSINTHKL